jgi:hypothetical protein
MFIVFCLIVVAAGWKIRNYNLGVKMVKEEIEMEDR